jgi:hypothetical protein
MRGVPSSPTSSHLSRGVRSGIGAHRLYITLPGMAPGSGDLPDLLYPDTQMAWRLGRPWGGCAACGRARLASGLYFRNVQECCGLREGLCSALCLEGRREIGAWHGSWHATPSGFCRREAHHYGNINAGAPPELTIAAVVGRECSPLRFIPRSSCSRRSIQHVMRLTRASSATEVTVCLSTSYRSSSSDAPASSETGWVRCSNAGPSTYTGTSIAAAIPSRCHSVLSLTIPSAEALRPPNVPSGLAPH